MKQYLHLEVPLEPGALKDTANRLNLMASGLEGPMLPGIVTTTIPEVVPAPVETTIPEVVPAPVETTIPEVVVSTDNRGMVHDSRIHSATPTINADGTWRNKRGVDKALLAQVEAELLGQPAPVAEAPLSPAPAPAPVVEAPVPPVAPAASQIETFGELMSKVTINMVNPDKLIEAVSNAGLQSIELLAARPDLVPQVAAELGL